MHQRIGVGGDGSVASVASVLSGVSGELTAVLGEPEWWRLPGRDLTAGVDAAYRLVAQAQAVALSLLGELDARGLSGEAGAASTQAWVAGRLRLRPQQAKRDVMVAQLLHNAETAAAAASGAAVAGDAAVLLDAIPEPVEGAALRRSLAAGGVHLDQAAVIATALTELPDDAETSTRVLAEELLVAEAAQHDPVALARLGHRIAERVDPDAADRSIAEQLAGEERQARQLRSGTRFADGHGSVFYKFRVPVGDDAWIWPILDTLAAPDPAGDGISIGGADTRGPQQRLADAFVEAMRRVGLDGGLPSKGGDRPRALLTMDYNDLKAGLGAATMVDTGDQLDPGSMRHLACDAHIIPQVLDGQSQLLDQGRAVRTANGPLRVAVYARDGGCVHPGCGRPPRWCDVHHAIAWWNGGPTSLTNCVTLCSFHHRLYDAGTWSLRFAADGVPEAIPPPWIDPEQKPRRHERFTERHRC